MDRRRTLRRLTLLAVALLLGATAVYLYATRPAALEARLVELFARFRLEVRSIDAIDFGLFRGLTVRGLRAEAGDGFPLPNTEQVLRGVPLLEVEGVHVEVSPWALLAGRPRARRIDLERPRIALVGPEFGELLKEPRGGRSFGPIRVRHFTPLDLPEVRLRDANVSIYSVDDGGGRLERRWRLSGVGRALRPAPEAPVAYRVDLWQVGGALWAADSGKRPVVRLDWTGAGLVAEMDWLSFEAASSLLPQSWRRACADWQPTGRARLARLEFRQRRLTLLELRVRDVGLCLPIEDGQVASAERYARLAGLSGTLRVEFPQRGAGRLEGRLEGRLNDAPLELELSAGGVGYHLDGRAGEGAFGRLGIKGLDARRCRVRLDVRELELPTLEKNAAFCTASRLPGVVRSSIRKYNVRGRADLHVELELAADGPWRYSGYLEARQVAARYYKFPYEVRDITGRLRFDNDGLVLEDLRGRHGAAQIFAQGRVNDTTSYTGFDLVFRATNVTTDGELYAALPPEYRGIWEKTTPEALCDVRAHVTRPQGDAERGSRPSHTVIDVRLLGGSLALRDDMRLTNAGGVVRIDRGTVELRGLTGFLGSAEVRLDGTVRVGQGDTTYELRLSAAGMPLERASRVRGADGREVGRVRFAGTGDVWAELRSGAQGGDAYTIRINDGRLAGFAGDEGWEHVSGWVTLTGDQQVIHELRASRPDGQLELAGTLPASPGYDTPVQLRLQARDADIGWLLGRLVPGRWSGIRQKLGLSGAGTLAVDFHPQPTPDGATRQVADVELTADRARPAPLPLDLRSVSAAVTLRSGGFVLRRARAQCGDGGRVEVSGEGGWSDGDAWTELKVVAEDVRLSREFAAAMPAPLARLLGELSPRGRAQISFDRLRMTGSRQRRWEVDGRIELRDLTLSVGVPLREGAGRLVGRCVVLPDGRSEVTADFEIDRGTLDGWPIERWEGRLVRKPDRPLVALTDISGRFCGGEVRGNVAIDPQAETYELTFDLHDVSLAEFIKSPPGQQRRGRIDGHVFVRGSTDDLKRRIGGGELRIRDASLLSSKVTRSVVEAGQRHQRPVESSVDQALVKFVWEGSELRFTQVDIQSRRGRMVGQGVWDTADDSISLVLVGAIGRNAPRITPLTELVEATGRELIQYRVTGTIDNPKVSVEPLHNLTEPLRRLFEK